MSEVRSYVIQSALSPTPVNMKVVSWTRKLSFTHSTSPTKTRLRKSVTSLSRLLSPALRRQRRRESKVLLPLRIKLDSPCEVVVRSNTTARDLDRSQIRLILQQRLSQRIRDRSRAAVIREARTQLQTEIIQEDVYVPWDFARERKLYSFSHNQQTQEEELYMTMS